MTLRRGMGPLARLCQILVAAVLAVLMLGTATGCSDVKDAGKNAHETWEKNKSQGDSGGHKGEINDLSIIDSADGDCDDLPQISRGTERDIDCRYTLQNFKENGGGRKLSKTPQNCSVRPDPTTHSGCITPRTLKLLNQVKRTGYAKHDITCFAHRDHKSEHPEGRACDVMMTTGGRAKGDDKTRGDKLAAWAVANHNSLGIMYVIWYDRIWTNDEGWHHYGNPFGGNDPSGHHTNHVHLSVY